MSSSVLSRSTGGGVWQRSSGRFQQENWRYAAQPVCQSLESKGQLSVIAMIGGIMGCSHRAKWFNVVHEDGLTLLDPLEEEVVVPATSFFKSTVLAMILSAKIIFDLSRYINVESLQSHTKSTM